VGAVRWVRCGGWSGRGVPSKQGSPQRSTAGVLSGAPDSPLCVLSRRGVDTLGRALCRSTDNVRQAEQAALLCVVSLPNPGEALRML
jgi:hypothetical protein